MNKTDFILFSGAAPGAEAEFGACAERHGIEEVNFTFDGHTEARRRGIRVLNHEELQAGDVSLEYVSRLMHRRYTDSPTIRKILQTLWYQVNNGQEIYVVGVIQDDGTVRGGTGLGRRVRQAVQQAAVRLRPGEGRLVRVDRRATGSRTASTRRRSPIRTSPAPARVRCTTTASARSRSCSRDRSSRAASAKASARYSPARACARGSRSDLKTKTRAGVNERALRSMGRHQAQDDGGADRLQQQPAAGRRVPGIRAVAGMPHASAVGEANHTKRTGKIDPNTGGPT